MWLTITGYLSSIIPGRPQFQELEIAVIVEKESIEGRPLLNQGMMMMTSTVGRSPHLS